MLFWYSSWVRISSSECPNAVLTFELSEYQVLKCYFDIFELSHYYAWRFFFDIIQLGLFWHSSCVQISSFICQNAISTYFYIRAESFFDIIQLGITYPLVPKSPYLTSSGTGIKITVWGTYKFCLGWIFMKRADNQNRDTVLDVFDCEPDQTFHYRVICPRVPKAYIRHCQFSFNQMFMNMTCR